MVLQIYHMTWRSLHVTPVLPTELDFICDGGESDS